jgi:hemoglobin-like flavoprotein
MGLGIAGMHYLGMSAIRGCGLAYDFRLVGASLAIAISASMAALWFTFFRRNLLMTLAGGVVQGLAIASMHYTAMAATYFVPLGVEFAVSQPIFAQSFLAYVIAGGIGAISIGNLALLSMIRPETISDEQIWYVQETFRKIEPFAPLVGETFYRRLFEIAPDLRHLFPADLTEQSAKLMAMLAIAVSNLDNMEELEPSLRDLGRRHAAYGVSGDAYEPVGRALIWTLEQGLQQDFTPEVRSAWTAAYGALTASMLAGANEPAAERGGFGGLAVGRSAA